MTTTSFWRTWPTSWLITASSSRSSSRSSRPRVTQILALPRVCPKVKAFGVPSSTTPRRTGRTPASLQRRATSTPSTWSVA